MAWVVTLKVVDCETNAKLSNAFVTDGAATYFTDANGQLITLISDAYNTYIVSIGKSGYISKTFVIYRPSMEGTVQTVCLDKSPPPPPEPPTGNDNGDGW